jgi:hypothetical protein
MGEAEPMPPQGIFEIQVPLELQAGTYTNFLSVWHTPFEFTLDFAVTQPGERVNPDDPASPIKIPCSVVARLKIPPSLIFSVLQALNENMSNYEAKFGEIRRLDQ